MIAIKGIDMPSCCDECGFCSYNEVIGYVCKANYTVITRMTRKRKRQDSCPLVAIEGRKVGKWIYNRNIQNWECSECGEPPKTLGYVGTSIFMTEHFKFCNHCGTEMRGTEE